MITTNAAIPPTGVPKQGIAAIEYAIPKTVSEYIIMSCLYTRN